MTTPHTKPQEINCMSKWPFKTEPYTLPEPFGIWHQGATEEESDFFLFKDSGDVACENCIKLYTHPAQPKQEPLTRSQQMDIINSLSKDGQFDAVYLIWAVEKAHGIGGEEP